MPTTLHRPRRCDRTRNRNCFHFRVLSSGADGASPDDVSDDGVRVRRSRVADQHLSSYTSTMTTTTMTSVNAKHRVFAANHNINCNSKRPSRGNRKRTGGTMKGTKTLMDSRRSKHSGSIRGKLVRTRRRRSRVSQAPLLHGGVTAGCERYTGGETVSDFLRQASAATEARVERGGTRK